MFSKPAALRCVARVAARSPATLAPLSVGASALLRGVRRPLLPSSSSSSSSSSSTCSSLVRSISPVGPWVVVGRRALSEAPRSLSAAPYVNGSQVSGIAVDKFFGVNVFSPATLQAAVEPTTYNAYLNSIATLTPLPLTAADAIAHALLRWAQSRGATHYTHWFQPLTGVTAEKHDTFLDIKRDGTPISRFEGKHLIRGEPDGSSFPSGGLRATHTARGYTAWDPSSSPFVLDHGNGTTLYIPSLFYSWADNQALDDKTPLLRSIEALGRESLKLMSVLGETGHTRLHTDSGLEQEFFLIDREYYLKRPDLIVAHRTVLGSSPPKGQQMEDQYFAASSKKSLDAIHEFEQVMWQLGIPIQTRHREVAPGQYEVAPRFAESNVATDRNLLLMEQLKRVARKHGLAALVHEKPFKGVNGSGKHNNWSFGTNLVPSLLDPGSNPETNSKFMLFLAATLRAIDVHADLMRIAIAGAGNDHRLGANEAPPAIVSAYLGDDVDLAVTKFIKGDTSPSKVDRSVNLGVSFLPVLTRAETDRNRTSPFAFTGNKFEFRAVGSSQSPSRSNQILNTILADSIRFLTGEIAAAKGKGVNVEKALNTVARETLKKHQRVIFNGNGYSAEWPIEAAKRGLLNLRSTPDALATYASDKNIKLHESLGVLSRAELLARAAVAHEEYIKRIEIEANVFISMTITQIVPAAVDYQSRLAGSLAVLSAAGGKPDATGVAPQRALAARVTAALGEAILGVDAITAALHNLHKFETVEKSARFAETDIIPRINTARVAVDELETLLPAKEWPFPTYHQMLFHQD